MGHINIQVVYGVGYPNFLHCPAKVYCSFTGRVGPLNLKYILLVNRDSLSGHGNSTPFSMNVRFCFGGFHEYTFDSTGDIFANASSGCTVINLSEIILNILSPTNTGYRDWECQRE